MKIKHKSTILGRCSAIKLARLFIPAIALAVTSTHAAEVYNSDFTVDPVVDGEVHGGWWTDTSGASSVAYDGTNDEVDYVHIAATNSRWVNYDNTRTTVNVGYMKVVVSNFVNTSDPSDPDGPWLGFNYINRGNTTHWASVDITQNGTYEIMFNNSLAPVSFDNGAGWSGTLPAGTGLASLDNGANEVSLDVGASVVAGGAWRGFGVIASAGNTSVFPGATLSFDSIEVHDTVNLGTGNNAPAFNADPFQIADGEQDVAYVGSIATDASDADLDTLSFTKDSGPSWLSIASNGDLTGTPLVGDIGYNLFDVSVSDGNGGMDSATLVIGVGAPSSETTIVDWGVADPYDATIVGADTSFGATPPLVYDGADIMGDAGAYYLGVDALAKSKVFSAATSASGAATMVQDSALYDRIRVINGADDTDHETMIAWEDENWSAPHGGDELLSMTMGGFESGASLNQYSFIIQTSAGWFSTAMSTWAGAQTFTLPDVTAVDWFSFSATMNTDGATNVGGTILSPDFSDVISVGFYFHSADNGVDVSGLQVGHFQATVGNPGGIPNTDPVFTADPTVAVTAGVAGEAYTGETLAGSATDSDFGDSLTYSKVSGPSWLDVAPDGGLSGTPDAAGSPSTWTVQVTDSNGGTDTADLEITVTGSTTASMIVQWGLPNPYDTSIVDGSQNFSATPPLTYDGSDAVGGAGAYYNGVGIANRSIVFAAASSATGGVFQIQDNAGYDRIRITNTASNAHETMVAWESSEWLNTLGGDSLESITMGGFESGAATNQYSFIIQTSAGWFSTAAAEWGGAQTFTLPDVSAVDWYSFTTTMNTDAATNIGGSILAPDFSDVISVGFYFHGADNSGSASGLQVGYFQATIDTPSAGYSDWAATNAGGQTIDLDFDLDGVANGIEYFMGETGSGFTALPAPDAAGTTTYPMGATYAGAYGVDYYLESSSPDLSSWLTVDVGDVTIIGGTSISYTMPTGADAFFVRLVVLED
ncbi:MAG: putative Ig domain-containing protein [Opitutaceae bacterium]